MTAGQTSRGRLPGWLSAGLFLFWAWMVWGRSGYLDRGWSPRMLDEMLAPSQYAPGFSLQTLILWAGYAARILLVGGIFLSARAVGRRALAFLGLPEDLAGAHRAIWETALGLGTFCALWMLLGALGLYRVWMAWLVLAAALALAAWDWRHDPVRVGAASSPPRATKRSPLRGLCMITLLASLLLNALTILCPEGYYDTLVYHLGVPRSYLLHGRLGAVPFNAHQHTIGYWHMMYVWGLLLWDEVFCKVLHAGAGVLLIAAVVSFVGAGLQAGPASGTAGWIAGVLVGTAPVVCLSGWPAAAEMPTALFGALCGIAAIRAASLHSPSPSQGEGGGEGLAWARLAGVAGGLALGTKYTGGLAVAAATITLLAARAWRPAALVAGLSAAVASPWFVKNAVLTGNPVFPYLGSVFGLGGYDPADVARFIAATTEAPVRSLLEGARHLWVLSVGEPGAAAGLFLGSAFLLLAPLVFLTAPVAGLKAPPIQKAPSFRWLVLYVAVGVAGWLAATRLARYGLPVLPLVAILLALAVDRAKGGLRALAVGGLLFAAWFNLYEIAKITYYASQGMRVTLGLQSPESFMNSGHLAGYTAPSHGVMAWANAHLPREAVVLCLGEPRGAYLQRRFIAPSVYDRQPLANWVKEARDPAGVAARLKQEGVTHLLVNEELLRREGVERVLPWTAPERARFDAFASAHLAPIYKEGAAILYAIQ